MATTDDTSAHPTTLPAGDWRVVPADSKLGFLTHIVFGLIPVRGRYSGYAGNLHVDSAANASGELLVDAATIRTGIKKRDAHLRSGDFFAAEQHPHLRFEVDALVRGNDDAFTLTGTLHIRGAALPIKAPIAITSPTPDLLRMDADFEVDHGASTLGWKRVPGTVRVQATLSLQRTG